MWIQIVVFPTMGDYLAGNNRYDRFSVFHKIYSNRVVCQLCLSVCADEQMYRCEDCDELFSSALELRRHQKYSCSSTGSIFDTLREDFKQERDDSDEPIHECKDCEKIFPNEYRYLEHLTPHKFIHIPTCQCCGFYYCLHTLMSLCSPYQVWDNTW